MRIIFFFLLVIFSLVSAFITYLFTSSLATNSATLAAFACLGLAFDGLKSCLPAACLDFIEHKKPAYAALCALVCCLLISFSLFASFQLLDNGSQNRSRPAVAYKLKLEQIQTIKAQQAKLLEFDKASKAAEFNTELERLQAELLQLPAPATAGKKTLFIANIALSILLELSIFACHIAMRRAPRKQAPSKLQERTQKSASNQHGQGVGDNLERAQTAQKGDFNALKICELAALIESRQQSNLPYRQLERIYKISSAKVKLIKDHIAQERAAQERAGQITA